MKQVNRLIGLFFILLPLFLLSSRLFGFEEFSDFEYDGEVIVLDQDQNIQKALESLNLQSQREITVAFLDKNGSLVGLEDDNIDRLSQKLSKINSDDELFPHYLSSDDEVSNLEAIDDYSISTENYQHISEFNFNHHKMDYTAAEFIPIICGGIMSLYGAQLVMYALGSSGKKLFLLFGVTVLSAGVLKLYQSLNFQGSETN